MLLVFLLVMTGVSDEQTVETESMSVIEGDAVTLPTDFSEIQNDDTILWMFGPKDTLISQIKRQNNFTSFFVTDNVKFRGRLQVDQNTGSLTIRNTRIRHSGQYKLSISREKITFKVFNVTVFAVVGETDGVKSVSISVLEGDPVTLHTDSEIHQDALMLWRFGDKGVLLAKIDVETNEASINDADERFRDRLQLDQIGSLTIKNTRTTDSGLYELQIRGSESLQRFLLSVLAVPDPGLSSGAIAGVVIGVIVSVLLLLGGVVTLIYFRHTISKLKRQMGEEKIKEVTEGESVILNTGLTEIQVTDLIKWYYETEDNLIAEINRENIMTQEGADGRFSNKVKLDERTGDLTISNIRTIHSGLYKLKISSSGRKNKYKGFIVSVSVEEKKETVTEGESVTLHTGLTETQGDVTIQWCYETADNLIAEISNGLRRTLPGADGRFRSKLKLNEKTGDLTISNIRTIHSGLYKLKISSSTIGTKYKRFIVSVNVKSVPVTTGGSVILHTNAEIQRGDLILWTFGAENLLVKVDLGMNSISERFRDRLELDHQTGSLTIRNITDTDSGHFKLQIINREQTTFRRFNVTVSDGDDSARNQVNESVTEVMPLLSENVPNEANEQEETSLL